MWAPLLGSLLSAAQPAESPTAPDTPAAQPPREEALSLAFLADLFEHWSVGYTAGAAVSLGRDGARPAFALGLGSTTFEGTSKDPWPRPVDVHLGLELGARAGERGEVELRGAAAGRPVALGPLALGVSSSIVAAWQGGFAMTGRVGPELSAHLRLGNTRHVLQPFARCEWSLLFRDRFDDRAVLGLQFLLSD